MNTKQPLIALTAPLSSIQTSQFFGTTKALHLLTGDAIKKQLVVCFKRTLKLQPDSYWVWYNQGKALLQLRHYEEALNSFDRAIEFKPDFFIAWYHRGITLSARGRYEKAIGSFNRAIEINSNSKLDWYHKGIALERLGYYLQAIACFNKVYLWQQ